MATDAGKKMPAVKDMKNVIAQLEKSSKGNMGLRPTGPTAQKAPQPTGAKPSITPKGLNESIKTLRKSTTEKDDGLSSPATTAPGKRFSTDGGAPSEEAANPFKVALKPVAKPSVGKPTIETEKPAKSVGISKTESPSTASSVSSKTKMFDKPAVKAETIAKEDADKEVSTGGSTVSNRFKQFEAACEKDSPNTSSSSPGSSMKSKANDNANSTKVTTAPKPVSKSPFVAGVTQNSSNRSTASVDKEKKNQIKSDDTENDSTSQSENAPDTTKPKGKRFANDLENKISQQHPAKTREPSSSTSGTNTLTKKIKEPPENPQKANQVGASEDNEEAIEQPKVPPRSHEKLEKPKSQTKAPSTSTEESDQPKIPPRKEQKVQEAKATEKAAPPTKKSPTANQKTNETKQSKTKEKSDQNENKTGLENQQSLLRNKARPLPNPTDKKDNQKKYRLLPVPKPSGNPPRKLAKPPAIDLSKYVTYAKSRGLVVQVPDTKGLVVQVPDTTSSAASYDDDDLYEDCDNIPVNTNTSRISEYTEEEEAKIENTAKAKPSSATDNYGKMFNNNNTIEYEDDDEIYQEID